jgi:hypothetical protein
LIGIPTSVEKMDQTYENEDVNVKENEVEELGEVHNDADEVIASGSLKINSLVLAETEFDDKEIITGDGVIRVQILYSLTSIYPSIYVC